jgi:hypothetical protein
MIVETEPAGARVYVNGELQGESPVVTEQRTSFGQSVTLRVEADGFQPTQQEVAQSEWFLWPAVLAVVPLLGIPISAPFLLIPLVGPIISLVVIAGWAIVTSPSLIALAFIRKYPEKVEVRLVPKTVGGVLQPTDTWLIPEDMSANPPPLVTPKAKDPEPAPFVPPPQPDGGNPIP